MLNAPAEPTTTNTPPRDCTRVCRRRASDGDSAAVVARDSTTTSTPSTSALSALGASASASVLMNTVRDTATPSSVAAATPSSGMPTTPAHEPPWVGATMSASAHDMAAVPVHCTV